MFARFEDYYGHKWINQWGGLPLERVKKTWAEELAGFRDKGDCLAEAIKVQLSNPFPPTLPEFLATCRDQAKRLHPTYQALPAPPIPPEVRAANLEKLRAIANGLAAAKQVPQGDDA